MTSQRKILQIIPAPGWCAVYEVDAGRVKVPLACWALVQVKDATCVVGMAGHDYVDFCDDTANFIEYEHGEVSA